MKVKASKLALLAAGAMAQNNMTGADATLVLGEYTNLNGETCQLQLVATANTDNHNPVDPQFVCVETTTVH